MRATARRLGKRLTGSLTPCPFCAKVKSKRKKIAKETERLNFSLEKELTLTLLVVKNQA